MEKENNKPENFTTRIPVTGIPLSTKAAIDKKADKQGITTSAYIKNLINQDLKADNDRFNKAG